MNEAGVFIGVTVLLLITVCLHRSQCSKRYDGHKLIRVTPETEDHVTSLRELLRSRNDVDVWKESAIPGKEVHIHLSPQVLEDFSNNLSRRSLTHEVLIENTQDLLDDDSLCCPNASEETFDTCYHTLNEIQNELYRLENDYPDMVTVTNLGQSFEGRNMLGIEINQAKQTGAEANKQGLIFVNGGIHAREWISVATSMYIIRQLLNSKDSDQEISNMLKTFKWFFLPVLNVDGYDYTHRVDRLWRKNRKLLNAADCNGVDLNRNFASDDWGKQDCIHDTCCETYPGQKAFSESESANVAAYLRTCGSELKAFFDLHAYSQMWLSPWGHSEERPPDYYKMEAVMKAAKNAIMETSGKVYLYGPAYSTIYPAYGVSVDYAYDTLNVTHSYAVELRPADDNDRIGFLLPPCQIISTGNEMIAALKAITAILAKEIKEGSGEIKGRKTND